MSQVPPQYSNYPRPNTAIPDPIRPPGVYWETIGWAFDLIRKQTATWIGAVLVMLAINYGISLPMSLISQSTIDQSKMATDPAALFRHLPVAFIGCQLVGTFISMAVQYVLLAGLQSMAVKQIRGEPISVGDVFGAFSRIGQVAGASILSLLIIWSSMFITLGLAGFGAFYAQSPVLMLVGGLAAICVLLLLGPLALVPLIAAQEEATAFEAISLAFQKCPGAMRVQFSLLWLGASFVSGLGVILCCIGLLYTYAVLPIVIAFHYTFFFPPKRMEGFMGAPIS